MNKEELISHIDQLLKTAASEGAKQTVDHLLDLRFLLKPQTNN